MRKVPRHAHSRHGLARQGRLGHRRRPPPRRARGHRVRPRPPGLRGRRPRRAQLRPGGPHRRRRRLRGRPRPRRGDPRRGAARAVPQPRPHGVPQQPDERLQHARGRRALGRAALRQRLVRDRPRLLLPRAPLPARLRAGRRGSPDPAAGPLRDRQVLQRAADGRRHAAQRHRLPHHPPELGPVGGQLRPQPRPAPARPGGGAERLAVGLHRRLRPRRRARARRAVRARHPRGLLHRQPRQPRQPSAGRHPPPPPRRRDPAARAPPPPRRPWDQHRQGAAAARLRPAAVLARLPQRGRRAARAARERLENEDTGVQRGRAIG